MLTPKQWRERSVCVLNVIEKSLDDIGVPPTVSEIGAHLRMSKATVHEALAHMKRDGILSWDKHKARTLTVTDDGDRLYEEARHG